MWRNIYNYVILVTFFLMSAIPSGAEVTCTYDLLGRRLPVSCSTCPETGPPNMWYPCPPISLFYELTVNKVGNGTVSLSPPASSTCGSNCWKFPAHTQVTLFTSLAGSTLTGGCSGRGSCLVTMDQNKTVTANFRTSETPPNCPIISNPSCPVSPGAGNCSGGCVETAEGQDAVIAVSIPLSRGLQNFVNTMKGSGSISDSSFDSVIRELPASRMSRIREVIFSGQRDRRYFRSVEIGGGLTVQFERKRGPGGYFVWVPIQWAPSTWRSDLNLDQKNDELASMVMNSTWVNRKETFLTVIESLALAFPGVYGTNELINGGSGGARVLGAVSVAADLATFGIGSGLRVMGRTAVSAQSCRAIVVTGAAARITNAVQNPSLGTGIDAALATVEGSLVGVQFVSVVIRGGRGFIKGGSDPAAKAIARSLGRHVDDISLNGNGPGLTCSELARLGVRVRVNGGSTVYVERLVGTELVPEAMSRNTKVYRCEMPNTCPFQVHESPFFNKVDYGLLDRADFDVTYIHTSRETLERLRTKQGYFEAGCCIRESTLGEVMEKAGPNSRALIDYKANATVGGDGTSIVVIKPNPW